MSTVPDVELENPETGEEDEKRRDLEERIAVERLRKVEATKDGLKEKNKVKMLRVRKLSKMHRKDVGFRSSCTRANL